MESQTGVGGDGTSPTEDVEESTGQTDDTENRSGDWGRGRSSDWGSSIVASSDWGTSGTWGEAAIVAHAEKRTYQEKLEDADSHSVFKYVFLINSAAVEQYVSQSRAQAATSFILSRMAALAGFTLLILSILIGLVAELSGRSLSIAYLAGIGGVLTEFIAGVFFWIYNRTLQQINMFYQGMMTQQHEALTAIGRSSELAAQEKRDRLAAGVIGGSTGPPGKTERPA